MIEDSGDHPIIKTLPLNDPWLDESLGVEAAELTERPWLAIHERTAGVGGWVSLEVSPLLAYDAKATVAEARALHKKANRRNLFIKIPGTKEGAPAIEDAIFLGVPVNVTLLFTRDHYLAAAEAYMRGLELRVAAGLSPDVPSVASLFISRSDKATMRAHETPNGVIFESGAWLITAHRAA